jgi:hypothetical protein
MTSNAGAPTSVEQLEAILLQRSGRQIRGLRVRVDPGGLVLQGRATTYYAKQLAQHAAMQVTGLPIMANEIEVNRGPVA